MKNDLAKQIFGKRFSFALGRLGREESLAVIIFFLVLRDNYRVRRSVAIMMIPTASAAITMIVARSFGAMGVASSRKCSYFFLVNFINKIVICQNGDKSGSCQGYDLSTSPIEYCILFFLYRMSKNSIEVSIIIPKNFLTAVVFRNII